MPSAFICIEKYFYEKKIKKILVISKAIKVFESPLSFYVFGNLSVLSIYSEVHDLEH